MADVPDPFKPSDATILRPRPGAGRRSDAAAARPSAPVEPFSSESMPAATRAVVAPGLSSLVQAASPLLLLAGHLRGVLASPDVPGLRRHVREEMRRFEERARAAGVSNEIIKAAGYVLCAGLDESVLSTPWGSQSEWAQQTLLIALHREAWGGEKFFEMLARLGQDPDRHIDLMELQYLCLAFGFAGKYQAQARGHVELADVRMELFRQIRGQRGAPKEELSLRWRGLEDRRNPLVRYVPWWVVGAAALAIMSIAYLAFYLSLSTPAESAETRLNKLAAVEPTQTHHTAVVGQTLKQLLNSEELQHNLIAQEFPGTGKTVITLDKPEGMFDSGSTEIGPDYTRILQRVAEQLRKVGGSVTVKGHTDAEPIRSFRYNNTMLSRERAAKVVEILKNSGVDPASLTPVGVGAEEPLNAAEPFAKGNRRVEIIHYVR